MDVSTHLANFLYSPENKTWDEDSFEYACLKNIKRTKSQNFQDVFALWATGGKPFNNYYVEFGATNGVDGSNTYLLDKSYAWRGLLVEPIPSYFEELKVNRHPAVCVPAVVSNTTGDMVDFVITNEKDLSTVASAKNIRDEHWEKRQIVDQVIQVRTITLFDLLRQYNAPYKINYISVDTEGTEYDIMKKFFDENDAYSVGCYTIEHNWNQDKATKLLDLFTANGYQLVYPSVSRWDFFFLRNDHHERLFKK